MPALLLFAACEKVIIGEDDHNVSLITILQNLSVQIPQGSEIPPDLNAPMKWSVIALWRGDEADQSITYRQSIQLTKPDGNLAFDASLDFNVSKGSQPNVVIATGFPVAQPGVAWLRLFLQQLGGESEAHLIASYPIEIVHAPLSVEPSPKESDPTKLDPRGRKIILED